MADLEGVSAGQKLRLSLNEALPDDWEWSERDAAFLDLIEETADRIAEFESVIAVEGVMARGSRGQPIVHPAAQESRHARAELARLLDKLNLPPDEDDAPVKSARHQRAANSMHERRRMGGAYGSA